MKATTRGILLAIATILPIHALSAQDFPNRPITLVVPSMPGSFPDTVARIFGEKAQAGLGVSVIVENKPGGAGILATERMLQAPHDGHTLLIADQQQWGIAPHVVANMSFDPAKDLGPVSILASSPMFLAVTVKSGIRSLADLLARAKENPDRLSFGTPGIASIHHLTWETILARTGMKVLHVPYKGGAQVVPALLAGEVDMALQAVSNLAPHMQSGTLRILAVATAERSPLMPDVPTFAEQGVAGIDFPVPLALMAPSDVPDSIKQRLAAEFGKAARLPEVVAHFRKMSIATIGSTAPEAAAFIAADAAKIAIAAKAAGLKPR